MFVFAQRLAYLFNLFIYVHKEAMLRVLRTTSTADVSSSNRVSAYLDNVIADPQGEDVNSGHVFFNQLFYVSHAEWVAATVTLRQYLRFDRTNS